VMMMASTPSLNASNRFFSMPHKIAESAAIVFRR